jgi:diguanylate cyclase (GGDEF)-like protein/PAS domain S-box-containing protein
MRELIIASLFFSAVVQAMLAAFVWGRRRQPGGRPLFNLLAICTLWALTYGMDLASSNLAVKTLWMQIRYSANIFLPLVILFVVFEDLGILHWITRRCLAFMLAVALLALALIWSGEYHTLYRYGYAVQHTGELDILTWQSGPLFYLVHLFGFALVAFVIFKLLRSYRNAGPMRRRQNTLVLISLLLPVISEAAATFGFSPLPGFNFTPHIMILTGGLLAFALLRYRWLDIVPLARHTLVDVLSAGVVVVDAANRIVDINPAARKLLNVSADVIGQNSATAFSHIDPQARAQFKGLRQARKEAPVRQPGGEVVYYDIELIPLTDQAGNFNGRVVMFHDITERKQEELHLLQLTQAIEQSPTSVVITDLNGAIEYVNPEFTLLTGYSLEEARGKNSSILQSGKTPPETYRQLWQTIQAGQVWRGEFLNKKKNGELYWELAVIAPVRDSAGQVINYIAIKENITAQREAETALRETNRRLEENIAEIAVLQVELREQAIRDPLTGLYNRRFLNDAIEREIGRARREGLHLSVVILDIDHFKQINDDFGHQIGDASLRLLANMLTKQARESDIVCRYGGEEFLLALPGATTEGAVQLAERLRILAAKIDLSPPAVHDRDLATPHLATSSNIAEQQSKFGFTISLGVATFPEHGQTAQEVIIKADQALYAAKRAGRNRVMISDAGAQPSLQ